MVINTAVTQARSVGEDMREVWAIVSEYTGLKQRPDGSYRWNNNGVCYLVRLTPSGAIVLIATYARTNRAVYPQRTLRNLRSVAPDSGKSARLLFTGGGYLKIGPNLKPHVR